MARVGAHREDFEKDRRAARWSTDALPVPEILSIVSGLDGWVAIAPRGQGRPLESLDAAGWEEVWPALVDALVAMADVDLAGTAGYGIWDGSGRAPSPTWRSFLLGVATRSDERMAGWRSQLDAWPARRRAFDDRVRRLAGLVDACPEVRRAIHGDLVNRNVLVEAGRLNAVLDWGCSLYGDPLYDLAWLLFWSPWHPGLAATVGTGLEGEVNGQVTRLLARLAEAGVEPAGAVDRLRCYWCHLAVDNLIYAASRSQGTAFDNTLRRPRSALAPIL